MPLKDLCFSAAVGQSQLSHRFAVAVNSAEQLADALLNYLDGDSSNVILGQSEEVPPLVFIITGQGSQYDGMGIDLYETSPTFRRSVDQCATLLKDYMDRDIRKVLFPVSDKERGLIKEPAYTQPALFAFEYAIAQLWRSWGVFPSIVMGHSVGEYVAACVA